MFENYMLSLSILCSFSSFHASWLKFKLAYEQNRYSILHNLFMQLKSKTGIKLLDMPKQTEGNKYTHGGSNHR